ncbi:MAG TPA: four helix bundle protein [Longimicrobiales bacterium]|nr:four helix bundle protein [Longimicrobiales bacterium]
MRNKFDHERLRVYQLSVDCYVACVALVARVPPLQEHLVWQLLRACSSITLNIAEGCAEFSLAEKARFYRMALRSAAECGAAITLLVRCYAVDKAAASDIRSSLLAITGMLVAMITATGRSRKKGASGAPDPHTPSP